MSVYSEIARIKAAKEAIRAAIEEKGVSVGDGTLDSYADKIGEIPAGGGDIGKLINGSITEIAIPNGTTKIRAYAFHGCLYLTSITIPDSVTSIGLSAFYSCTRLTSVTVPDSVTIIENTAFKNCTTLTEITIGKGVAQIGTEALNIGLSSKKATVKMKPTTPPTIQSNSIGANVEKIIVPAASLNAYLNATNWAAYADIIVEEEPVERWIINETPTIDGDDMYDIAFSSGNEIFSGLYLSTPTAIAYNRADPDAGSASAYDEETGWYDQAYRTVDFYEHPSGGLLFWLQENAVKIAETWVLDKENVPLLSYGDDETLYVSVPFMSNDSMFDAIDGGTGDLYYDGTLVCTIDPPEWTSEEYKTLHLMESPENIDNGKFLTWLQTNGTKQ